MKSPTNPPQQSQQYSTLKTRILDPVTGKPLRFANGRIKYKKAPYGRCDCGRTIAPLRDGTNYVCDDCNRKEIAVSRLRPGQSAGHVTVKRKALPWSFDQSDCVMGRSPIPWRERDDELRFPK